MAILVLAYQFQPITANKRNAILYERIVFRGFFLLLLFVVFFTLDLHNRFWYYELRFDLGSGSMLFSHKYLTFM